MNSPARTKKGVGALILAAGLSSRMGRPKMLLPWKNSTIIQSVVNSYILSGIEEIIVVTGGVRGEVEGLLRDLPVRLVFNPLYENGEMLDSLKIGLRSFSDGIDAAMIALGDQPRIEPPEISLVLEGYLQSDGSLIVPSYQMRRGHPWIVTRPLWDNLLNLQSPCTLRSFLQEQSESIQYVNVETPSILMDMDTPEDYERLKNEKSRMTAELASVKVDCWKFIRSLGMERMKFEPGSEPQTFDQASFLVPSGSYTTFRTYRNKTAVFHLTAHLARLEESARISQDKIFFKKDEVHLALRMALSEVRWKECRVRVTLDLDHAGCQFYVFVEELKTPTAAEYSDGVRVATIQTQRENPKAKLSSFIPIAKFFRDQSRERAFEILMISKNGEILEGMTSNFFAVKNRILRTAGEGVLEGITRTAVLDAARANNVSVEFEAVRIEEIGELSEAFITSSSRGILPVVQIDETLVGNGKTGLITSDLSREFDRLLVGGLEKI